MATRKGTASWARMEVGTATIDGANVELTVAGTKFGTRHEFKGRFNQYTLFDLAKHCLEGLNAIHAAKVESAEHVAHMIKRLRGGDL